MNTIEMRITHLKNDTSALYKDIYIDGKSFQQSLKKWYPSEFSKGRYKEEFMPKISSKRNSISHFSDLQTHKMIAPVYGCMDNCCIYLFAEIECTSSKIKWLRIAQDSGYFSFDRGEEGPLIWLENFEKLEFDRNKYERVIN
jgi:hypothetical protein